MDRHIEAPTVAVVDPDGVNVRMRLHQRGSDHEFWQVTPAEHEMLEKAHAAGVKGLDRTDDWLTYLGRRVRPAV